VLSGIVNGCIYAMAGLGLAIIFKGTRVLNAMQGDLAVAGVMVAVLLQSAFGIPSIAAIALAILAGVMLGALTELGPTRKMVARNASEESYLLLTIGMSFTTSAIVLVFVGRQGHLLPPIGGSGSYEIGEAFLQKHGAWLIGITLLCFAASYVFFRKTLIGLAMTAASNDPDGALMTGINVPRMRTFSFAIGSGMGALTGILIAPLIAISFESGIAITLKAFAAAILGGLSNPIGSLAGGLVIGLIESLAVIPLPSGYKDAISFGSLLAIMIAFPNGVLGRGGRAGG
jgi:branched-chain amino acid transport system permease protein